MPTLYLCGAGNSEGVRLAATVNRALGRFDRVVILDDDATKHGRELIGVPIVGPLDLLAEADPTRDAVVNLVARTCGRRTAMRTKIAAHGIPFVGLVHPTVDLAWTGLGDDVLVYEQAVISPETSLGVGSVVFMRAVIGHEAQLGPGCIVAAGAVLNARVRLGDGVYVGSNASVLPEVSIGDGATIGANSMVLADVPAGATVVGVPGQVVTVSDAAPRAPHLADRLGADELEALIANAWREVLGVEVADPNVNFADAGGTSLHALRIVECLRVRHGLEAHVAAFYRFPSVRSLAAHLADPDRSADSPGAATRGALRRARLSRA